MPIRSSYELDIDYGFALLEQLEGPEGAYKYHPNNPSEGDDSLSDVLLAGVFGGAFDPDQPEEFAVYNLEFPEDLAEAEDEAMAVLSEELDTLFSSWVLDRESGRVYITGERGERE